MITCPNCKGSLNDNARFCAYCGAALQAVPIQTEPETEQPESDAVQIAPERTEENTVYSGNSFVNPAPAPKTEPKKKGKAGKVVLFSLLGLLLLGILIAVSVFAVNLIINSSSEKVPEYTLFCQDSELYYWDFDKNGPVRVSRQILEEDISSDKLSFFAEYSLPYKCRINSDGDRLFYPDKNESIEDFDDGYNLYYRDPNKLTEQPVKVDSDITSYDITSDGNTVIYVKNGGLYKLNIKNNIKDKLSSDCGEFLLSSDGKRILFNIDGDFYVIIDGRQKELICSNAEKLNYCDDDITLLYYTVDGCLYKHEIGKTRQKIASDIEKVIEISENGKIYYLRSYKTDFSLIDYLDDDMAESDKKQKAPTAPPALPEEPTRPYSDDYEDPEEFFAALEEFNVAYAEYIRLRTEHNQKYNEYQELLDEYLEVKYRNEIREELKNEKYSHTFYALYYFDGTNETKVSDKITDQFISVYFKEKHDIVGCSVSSSEPEKLKMSYLFSDHYYDSASHLREYIGKAFTDGKEYKLLIDRNVVEFEHEDAYGYTISDGGNVIYYKSNFDDEKSVCDIYKVTVKDGKLGKAELLDSEVLDVLLQFVIDDKLLYLKDFNKDKCDLYIDKTRIDFDVYPNLYLYDEKNECLLYMVDWDFDDREGTLKMYKNGKSVTIAEDVSDYSIIPSGKVLYTTDFSTERNTGTLYYYENGESVYIADDVLADFQCQYPLMLYLN